MVTDKRYVLVCRKEGGQVVAGDEDGPLAVASSAKEIGGCQGGMVVVDFRRLGVIGEPVEDAPILGSPGCEGAGVGSEGDDHEASRGEKGVGSRPQSY